MKGQIRKISRWLAALFVTILVMTTVVGCSGGVTQQSTGTRSTVQTTAAVQTTAVAQTTAAQQAAAIEQTDVEDQSEEEQDAAEEQSEEEEQTAPEAQTGGEEQADETEPAEELPQIDEDGIYTSKEEVALYLHTYGKLPSNYITKNEAEKLGWKQKQGKAGQLQVVAPGKSIGGDRFGNYEGQLPEEKGRRYFECDINYVSGNRGAERIIYSNDGLIFYTDDHYQTFEQLYPEDSGE